jgi:hypothetical protein
VDLDIVACLENDDDVEAFDDAQVVEWGCHKTLDWFLYCFAHGEVFSWDDEQVINVL